MSANSHEIVQADDGTFAVSIVGGVGADAIVTNFLTREEAIDFVASERKRLGIDTCWQAVDD